jgi:hypothetical protein
MVNNRVTPLRFRRIGIFRDLGLPVVLSEYNTLYSKHAFHLGPAKRVVLLYSFRHMPTHAPALATMQLRKTCSSVVRVVLVRNAFDHAAACLCASAAYRSL